MGNHKEEKVREVVKNLRLIDDSFFRVFANDKAACEEILQTLLDDADLKIISVTPQFTATGFAREVIFDSLCKQESNDIIVIEVQKGNKQDDTKRCRLYLSVGTAISTPKGTDFSDVPNVTIIYITEYDALHNGQTVTKSCMCQYIEKTDRFVPLEDGGTVYYANTCVDDGTKKAELLKMFLERGPVSNPDFPNVTRAINYYKGNTKEGDDMCEAVEKYAEERIKEHDEKQTKKYVKNMLSKNLSLDVIAECLNITVEEVKALAES